MATPYVISSDLVSAYPAKSLEIAQYIDGFKADLALVQNAQTGTTYTLAAADFTKTVTLSNASPVAVTLPLEATVPWPAGTQLRLLNLGAGLVTVAGAVGVTINGSPLTLAQYKDGTLIKTGTDVWMFVGSPAAPGMDFITPTSVAGSGVTLSGGEVTFTAATTISVNGCFTAAYDSYVVMTYMTTGATGVLTMRLRAAGTDASGSDYNQQVLAVDASAVAAARTTAGTSWFGNAMSASLNSLQIQLNRPFLAASTGGIVGLGRGNDSGINFRSMSLGHGLATSYDGFTIAPGSASTGIARIYGLRNS
jgi:hypothetical protein